MKVHPFFNRKSVSKKRNVDSSSSASSSSKKAKLSWVREESFPRQEQFAGEINEFMSSDKETLRLILPDHCNLRDVKKLNDKFQKNNMHGIEATDLRGKVSGKRNASIFLTKLPIHEDEFFDTVEQLDVANDHDVGDVYVDALEQPSDAETGL